MRAGEQRLPSTASALEAAPFQSWLHKGAAHELIAFLDSHHRPISSFHANPSSPPFPAPSPAKALSCSAIAPSSAHSIARDECTNDSGRHFLAAGGARHGLRDGRLGRRDAAPSLVFPNRSLPESHSAERFWQQLKKEKYTKPLQRKHQSVLLTTVTRTIPNNFVRRIRSYASREIAPRHCLQVLCIRVENLLNLRKHLVHILHVVLLHRSHPTPLLTYPAVWSFRSTPPACNARQTASSPTLGTSKIHLCCAAACSTARHHPRATDYPKSARASHP